VKIEDGSNPVASSTVRGIWPQGTWLGGASIKRIGNPNMEEKRIAPSLRRSKQQRRGVSSMIRIEAHEQSVHERLKALAPCCSPRKKKKSRKRQNGTFTRNRSASIRSKNRDSLITPKKNLRLGRGECIQSKERRAPVQGWEKTSDDNLLTHRDRSRLRKPRYQSDHIQGHRNSGLFCRAFPLGS